MELNQETLDNFSKELKGMVESVNATVKTHGTNVDKVMQDLETLKAEAKAAKEAMLGMEAKLNTPGAGAKATAIDGAKAFGDAYMEWARKGKAAPVALDQLSHEEKQLWALNGHEQKLISAFSDPAGGYLMPQNRLPEMVKLEVEYCPMLAEAMIIPMSTGDTLELPKKGTTDMAVAIQAESATRTATTSPTVELVRIPIYDYEANVVATSKMTTDPFFPIEPWLNEEYADQVGITFGEDCVNGTGAGEPTGFTAETVQSVVSGASAALQISTLPKLMFKVKKPYRLGGKWACNGTTAATIYGLALTTGYQPFVGINPTTLAITFAGKDVIEMPELADIGSSAYPIYFGNWKKACVVGQRMDVEVLRNPYMAHGFVYFWFKRRLGFKLVNPAAIAKMKSHTA